MIRADAQKKSILAHSSCTELGSSGKADAQVEPAPLPSSNTEGLGSFDGVDNSVQRYGECDTK